MVKIGAVQWLRSVTDIVGHDAGRGDEAQNVLVFEVCHHGFPYLPDAERQRPFFRADAGLSEAVEILFPETGGDIGRVLNTAGEHRGSALDVLDIDIGEVLNGFGRTPAMHPDIVRHVGKGHEPFTPDFESLALGDGLVRKADAGLVELHQARKIAL